MGYRGSSNGHRISFGSWHVETSGRGSGPIAGAFLFSDGSGFPSGSGYRRFAPQRRGKRAARPGGVGRVEETAQSLLRRYLCKLCLRQNLIYTITNNTASTPPSRMLPRQRQRRRGVDALDTTVNQDIICYILRCDSCRCCDETSKFYHAFCSASYFWTNIWSIMCTGYTAQRK